MTFQLAKMSGLAVSKHIRYRRDNYSQIIIDYSSKAKISISVDIISFVVPEKNKQVPFSIGIGNGYKWVGYNSQELYPTLDCGTARVKTKKRIQMTL